MNIFIAGHNGMVGSAIYRELSKDSNNNIIVSSKDDLNLLDQNDVNISLKTIILIRSILQPQK